MRSGSFGTRDSSRVRPLSDWSQWETGLANGLERHHQSIERRVAIDEIDPLQPDAQLAGLAYQPVKAGAAEQALLVAAEFDHHEFRSGDHEVVSGLLDRDVGHD